MRIFSKGGAKASLGGGNLFSTLVVAATVFCCSLPALASEEIGVGQVNTDGMFTTSGENWLQTSPLNVLAADFASYPLEDFGAPDTPNAPLAGEPKPKIAAVFTSVTDPEIFGTVSIAVSHLAIETRWRSIAPVAPKMLFGAVCKGSRALCDSPLMHVWSRLRASLSGQNISTLEILRRVNAEVNGGIRYRTDTENYGVPDYWASPAEVARRSSADCKEFALVKMWILAALGVPNASMRIVVVRDMQNGLGHAILSVRLGGANLVLDNLTNRIHVDRTISWYQPLYSVSTTGSWIHGVRRATTVSQIEPAQVADASSAAPDSLSD